MRSYVHTHTHTYTHTRLSSVMFIVRDDMITEVCVSNRFQNAFATRLPRVVAEVIYERIYIEREGERVSE